MNAIASGFIWMSAGVIVAVLVIVIFIIGVIGTPFVLALRGINRSLRIGQRRD